MYSHAVHFLGDVSGDSKKNGQDEAGSKVHGKLSPAEQSTGQEQGYKEVCVDAHRADAGLDEEFKLEIGGWVATLSSDPILVHPISTGPIKT